MVNEDFRRIRMTFSAYNHQKSHIPAKIDLRHIQKAPTKKDPRHIQKATPKSPSKAFQKAPAKSHARSPFRPQLPGFTPFPHTLIPYQVFPERTRGTGAPCLRLRSWRCRRRCPCCTPCAFLVTGGARSGCALSRPLHYG